MNKLELSKKRTILASRRTLLSYIRTSIVCISLSFAYMKIDKSSPIDAFTIILFCLSGFFLIVGLVDYFLTNKSVNTISDKL